MKNVRKTERGWAGHFCCSHECLFRRNTLVELGNKKIVVSTVGLMLSPEDSEDTFIKIGIDTYFETMCFYSNNNEFDDADGQKPIFVDKPHYIGEPNREIDANNMHETIVNEITEKLLAGRL